MNAQIQQIQSHPAANIFPMMDDVRLQELADDIAANGLRVPIQMLRGEVIDGRNRLKACTMAGIEPRFVQVATDANPWQLAWALNGQRRDLNDAQRYMIWADCNKGDVAYQAEQKRIQDAANRARADAAREQHKFSNPRAGETKPFSGSPTICGATKVEPKQKSGASDRKAEAAGVTRKTVDMADALTNKRPDLADEVRAGKITLSSATTQARKEEKIEQLTNISAQEVKAAKGVYDVIVLDPPWPMEKIERDVRPNQTAFDYPTMSEAAMSEMNIPAADDCHVWVWTTHKFLPMALRLLTAWDMKYVCTFVWHKPGGFQPIGLPQYNAEFALYARKGSPSFIETKAFPVCFQAPRGAHSEKPEEFYDVLRRVTAGRRLDMFNRRKIEGFDGWGNESV